MKAARPIAKLPITLANQIAAGEVIERPANVIKELLENSLDAGATKIYIDVAQAGIKSIVIRDNGFGIAEAQLPLAIAPHATSKIASLTDLENIGSFGFRGEALASISSVAEVSIASCINGESAYVLKSHPDKAYEIGPTSHPEGTSITVQHLFFNVPARRKFLKSEQTERLHIENTIKRLALSRFDVGFFYRYEDKPQLQLPACNEKSQEEARISAIMGDMFLKGAIFLETEASGLSLRGWFYFDKAGFSHNEFQIFLVNGRCVKDKIFNHAMRQATLSFLESGRFAGFVFNLTMDPRLVDVNVHPTKSEVRFRYPNQVHDFLLQTFTRMLKTDIAPLKMPYIEHHVEERMLAKPDLFQPQLAQALPHMNAPIVPKPNTKSRNYSCFYSRFLMIEQPDGPIVIDAMALKKQEYQTGLSGKIEKKPVLMPLVFPVSRNLGPILNDALAFFDFSQSAENQYVLRAIPRCCDITLDASVIVLFLEKLSMGGPEKAGDWLAEYFAQMFMRDASSEKINAWLSGQSLQANQHVKPLSAQAFLSLFK